MKKINGNDIYQMFNYGTYYITKERQHLNDINVFPVADGDTGDNLLQTLRTIVLQSTKSTSFDQSLASICEAALLGARGNSGVIFAQFVNGLQQDQDIDEIDIVDFASRVQSSYQYTYSSLSNPVEGTMLTVINEWGTYLVEYASSASSLEQLFGDSYQFITEVLNQTSTMLDILSKNHVVDSGALGFTLFVKGIVSYYKNEPIDVIEYESLQVDDPHQFEGEITYRYCTEGLVKFKQFDHHEIELSLAPLGDSLIIAQGKNRFRVHIHSNDPVEVFQVLSRFGDIEFQKVDDMSLEMHLKNSSLNRVLVTDSIADIDRNILDQHNVVVIPLNISIDNKPYLDKISIDNETLFSNLNQYESYPKTATPTVKYINDLFLKLSLKFEEIIVLTVSNELSATYQVIHQEAEKLNQKGKHIYVVDTYNNSVTEGLLVHKAIQLMEQGVATQDVLDQIRIDREKTEILVCLDTFKYAMMSGRLPKVIGTIGMFLGIRPIMSLDKGKGTAYGMAFSQTGITKKIQKIVKDDMGKTGIEEYAIVHCLNPELAEKYTKLFTDIIGKKPTYISEISSATAIHSGIGSVAIGYIKT